MDQTLLTEIRGAIESPQDQAIDELFLRLFRRHYALNLPYRRYCDANGVAPSSVVSWRNIPAAPAAAFRAFDLTCAPVEHCIRTFYSSGTTSDRTSKHYMDADAVALYDLSATSGFARAALRAQTDGLHDLWALMPSVAQAPNSSLSHMLVALNCDRWFWDDWLEFFDVLSARHDTARPIALFGTAIAFLATMEAGIGDIAQLPVGSVLIETGGFKGSKRAIDRNAFYDQLSKFFGMPDDRCWSEYGMCELSSQYYGRGVGGALHGPPWLRTRIIDPETGNDAAPGERGLLRHYDLANWNSVAAVQTQDVAVADDRGGFRLLGRAPGAEVRGCSLMVT